MLFQHFGIAEQHLFIQFLFGNIRILHRCNNIPFSAENGYKETLNIL